MPISGNWRKGVWLWQNWILFSSEISVVSFPHPQKSSTDNSFIFFFFCIPYNDSTMFFETDIAALGSEPRQNLLSKPWLHLHTLLMSWHGQLFLCDRGPLCSHWHHWLLWTPIAPMLVHGGSHRYYYNVKINFLFLPINFILYSFASVKSFLNKYYTI